MNKNKSLSTISKYRQWNKVIQPLNKFQRNTSIYGYPLDFYYELENIISAGNTLSINIVTTLSGSKDNCIRTVFQKEEEVGKVIFQKALVKSTFDNGIQYEQQQRLNKLCQKDGEFSAFYESLKENNSVDPLLPYGIIKEKNVEGDSYHNKTLILSKDEYKKILHIESNQIAQSFIWGSSKQVSMIRFFYFHNKKNSVAYQIDNYEGIIKKRFGKAQFKIKQQKENSLTFVKIMYVNKSFYLQTCKLVNFLSKHLKVKIQKIVTDWILDPFNKYFLIDVKEVAMSVRSEPIILQPIEDALSFLTCGVCQQKFKVSELKKILTDKLIHEFFEHLKKRQINLQFRPWVKKKISDLIKVCQLCFMLVVSESQLIKLQRNLAMITNSVQRIQQIGPKVKKNAQFNSLYEWRLFLYIEDIRNLIIDDFSAAASYYVMIKVHDSITSFQLINLNSNYHLLKGIKIHYLLSQHNKIDAFLQKTQINVRITKGPSWNDVIAEGCTNGLFQHNEKHTMRKFKQILVFDIKSRYSVVGIHIGLKLQGKLEEIDLQLNKFHNVYMVQNYANCYQFPAQWMETIDPSYCFSKADLSTLNYNFHLSATQKKMLFPDKKHNKLKLI